MNMNGNPIDPDNIALEKMKTLYAETATQFRYFLTWRQLLLAGYFAVAAALAVGFKWALGRQDVPPFVFPLAGAVLSVFFWALDYRNRELYDSASKTAARLEEAWELKGLGHFSAYRDLKTKLPHSKILAVFYLGCGLLMFLLAAFVLLIHLMSMLFCH